LSYHPGGKRTAYTTNLLSYHNTKHKFDNTVKPAHEVTSIKQSPVLKGVAKNKKNMFNFRNTVKPVLRGHFWDKDKVAL
jgi:hypothetical protein